MGKKGKRSRKAKKANKLKQDTVMNKGLFTKNERHTKVSNIYMQVMMEDMWHVIKQELRDQIQQYVDTGKTVEYELPLPRYSRTLQVRLYNDKSKESFVCFKYNKRVEEETKFTEKELADIEKEAAQELQQEIENGEEVDKNTSEEVQFSETELAEMEKEAMDELEAEISKELENDM